MLAVLAVVLCSATLPAKPALAAAGVPSAAAPSAPLQTPLDPAFIRYEEQFPLGTPQWVATGLGFGLLPDPVDLSYARGLTRTRAFDHAYPASFDLRTAGKLTSVKNQNPYGTCWTFASLGSLESCLMPGQNLDFSEDNMALTSGFDTGLTPALKYDYGGQLYMSTAYIARWSGPGYETDDAYGDGITPLGLTARVHVQDVSWFPARPASPQVPSTTENNDIKYAVTTYGACYVGMKWAGSGSYDSAYLKIQGVPDAAYYDDQSMAGNSSYVEQGHAVLMVGWNEDFPATNFAITPPGNGAFLVKNSWGPAWGPSGGYFWVSEYSLDGGAYTRGTSAAVSLTGSHTLAFRSADNAGNVEAVQTATIGTDPGGPWTVAYNNVTVKKGKLARFRFKVVDLTPAADVEIRIYKRARLIKRLVADDVKTGSLIVGSWKCALGKGTHAWKVYATDLAGNPPHVIGRKTLVVR
jgi:C1A family cysteine protease